MKVSVKQDACVGAGQCALVAGNVFDQDEKGIVMLLEESPEISDQPAARKASSLCPARAITIVED